MVNSLETMERKIKEFERYANIEIPEFLKIGIVTRQAEEGPVRTHLIMNSHRLATFQDIKTEVTNVKQAQSAVKARSGDAMDVGAFTKGSKGASKGSGKKQDSEVVCWHCEKKGHRASDCRKKERDNDSGKQKGSKKGDSKGRATRKRSKANATSVARQVTCQRTKKRLHSRDRMHRNGKRRFERIGDWSSAVVGKGSQNSYWNRFVCCSDCVSQECCGRLSNARHARQSEKPQTGVRQASSRSGCANSPSQAQRRVPQIREPESCGSAQSVDGGVRDERHGTRCLLPKERHRHQGVRIPKEQWHETGARENEWGVGVASQNCPIQPEYIEERHIMSVFFTFFSSCNLSVLVEVLEVAT